MRTVMISSALIFLTSCQSLPLIMKTFKDFSFSEKLEVEIKNETSPEPNIP